MRLLNCVQFTLSQASDCIGLLREAAVREEFMADHRPIVKAGLGMRTDGWKKE